ncbi:MULTISPECIES: tRNA pseudouridine(55) synthase TruB [unclassified Rickettsia]|uniref:tRNA pseudouridine(55) synthase TruB n=1 Tax=unclassified Rickettsia TaxID=114295 RepID=UPI0031333D6C
MNNYWLNIYKPKGISSAKAVAIIKRTLGKVKIGHAGTLDVEAEGILPLAVGEATKLMPILIDAKKTYIFTLQFGAQTDSGDYSGKIINTASYVPSKEEVFSVSSKFTGIISQTPPAFSAIKVNGVRSYKLARQGLAAELKARNITIYNLKCINFDEEKATATYCVECSKGTYIRSLAEDMALSLQSLAFVIELRRIQVGAFKMENAIIMSKPEESKQEITKEFLEEKSIRIEAILDDILVLDATFEQAQKIKYGQKCYFNSRPSEDDVTLLWVRYEGVLLAIGSLNKNCFNSMRVFNLIK